jgi:hypothetical protein
MSETPIEPGASTDKEERADAATEDSSFRPLHKRAIIAGAAVVIVAALGLLLRSGEGNGGDSNLPGDPTVAQATSPAPAGTPRSAGSGNVRDPVSVTISDVVLSPAAKIQAEKFKCVCGCNMILGACSCVKSPGSIDMKEYLQSLVNRELPPREIEKAMIEEYGPDVMPQR